MSFTLSTPPLKNKLTILWFNMNLGNDSLWNNVRICYMEHECLNWIKASSLLKNSFFLWEYSKQETRMERDDSTKVWPLKYQQLLHIEGHDFSLRPGFGGKYYLYKDSFKTHSQNGVEILRQIQNTSKIISF